ncbi:hypothetical protein [Falsiroseomonas ponticola]|uniref:hypothetical protein n=1 Tax=Falsiroseomonas ponticola TaxID=2786951 RepID=UPI001931BE19|nr:hypothetical protein [Roseomonas ponticola]
MALPLRIASYWLGVVLGTLAWFLAIDALEMWPLPVQLALASMVPMAGLWWHLVLFQDRLKAIKAARLASRTPTPAKTTAKAPEKTVPAEVPPLPEAALREALRQVRAEAAALAWDAALQRELQVRLEFDADFARAAAPLAPSEQAVLLLAARGPVVRKRLALAAGLLQRDRGLRPAEDPLRQRLQDGLAMLSPSASAEFALVMATAADLDPVEVAGRLAARARGEAPDAVTEAALSLLRDAAAALDQDRRPGVRAAMGARLAAEGPVQALLRIYLSTTQAPEAVALAALGATAPTLRWSMPGGRARGVA